MDVNGNAPIRDPQIDLSQTSTSSPIVKLESNNDFPSVGSIKKPDMTELKQEKRSKFMGKLGKFALGIALVTTGITMIAFGGPAAPVGVLLLAVGVISLLKNAGDFEPKSEAKREEVIDHQTKELADISKSVAREIKEEPEPVKPDIKTKSRRPSRPAPKPPENIIPTQSKTDQEKITKETNPKLFEHLKELMPSDDEEEITKETNPKLFEHLKELMPSDDEESYASEVVDDNLVETPLQNIDIDSQRVSERELEVRAALENEERELPPIPQDIKNSRSTSESTPASPRENISTSKSRSTSAPAAPITDKLKHVFNELFTTERVMEGKINYGLSSLFENYKNSVPEKYHPEINEIKQHLTNIAKGSAALSSILDKHKSSFDFDKAFKEINSSDEVREYMESLKESGVIQSKALEIEKKLAESKEEPLKLSKDERELAGLTADQLFSGMVIQTIQRGMKLELLGKDLLKSTDNESLRREVGGFAQMVNTALVEMNEKQRESEITDAVNNLNTLLKPLQDNPDTKLKLKNGQLVETPRLKRRSKATGTSKQSVKAINEFLSLIDFLHTQAPERAKPIIDQMLENEWINNVIQNNQDELADYMEKFEIPDQKATES